MPTTLPPQPSPDPDTLARAQARLLAEVSRLEAGPTVGDERAIPSVSHVAWLGPQGDWEAAHRDAPGDGRYRFEAVFARGGLGAVRRAEDRKLGRTVAIKELLRFDDKAVRRFVREAAITARLQHPGIVPLYDLGRDAEGRPFLCMKLVEGASLEQRIAAATELPARLELLIHVIAAADAVAYAHGEGVIHRDLKPANILVGETGEAVVIDWGLAKDLSQGPDEEAGEAGELDTVSDLTAAGSLLGTLRYMPPEQARGESVDARTDVYALGAVLYHLIAGVPPFHDRRSAQLVHDVLAARPRALAELVPAVPPALAAIVDKAMAGEPGRRYADVAGFAGDLRRFQAGLLVGAHSYSPAEVARLWLRRHRAVGVVAAAAVVAMSGFGVVAFARVREAREAEHDQRVVAEAAQDAAELRAAEAEAARRTATLRSDELLLAQARMTLELDPTAAFGLLAQRTSDSSNDAASRTLATAARSLGLTGAPMFGPKSDILQALRLSDGTWLAAGYKELWRWRPGEVTGEKLGRGGWLTATPEGDAWAIARRGDTTEFEVHRVGAAAPRRFSLPITDGRMYMWSLPAGGDTLIGGGSGLKPLAIDVASGRAAPLVGPDAPKAVAGLSLTPSPDGRRLAGVRDGRTLVVWDRETGAVTSERLPGEAGHISAFSADGRTFTLAVHTRPATPERRRGLEGDRIFVWREGGASRVVAAEWAVPARDAVVFVARREGRSEAWAEALDGRRMWTRQVHPDGADDFVAVPYASRDGRRVMWGFSSWDEVVDVATGTLIHEQHMSVSRGSLLADGDALLVPRAGGLLRVDLSARPWRTLAAGAPGEYGPGAVSRSGRWALRHLRGELARVDVQTGAVEALADACGAWGPWRQLTIDDAGRALVFDKGRACLIGHGRTDIMTTPAEWMSGVAFAPDGGRIAAAFRETLVEWDGPELAPRERTLTASAIDLEYAPDGRALAVLTIDGGVTIVGDGTAKALVDAAPAAAERARAIDFTPTGALAVYRRGAPGVTLHDLASGTTRRLVGGEADADDGESILHHSPSGAALAALDGDVLQRWSLTGSEAPIRLDAAEGWDFAFLDESRIVILTRDGGLELIETTSGTRAPLRRGVSGRPSPRLAGTGDGLVLLTWYGEVLRYTDAVPAAGEPLREWLRAAAPL